MTTPDSPDTARKRIHYDPTINLGHILTFIGFMLAGFGAYGNLDKRLTIAEVQSATAIERATEQERRIKDSLQELKNDIKDVQRAANDINRTLALTGKK